MIRMDLCKDCISKFRSRGIQVIDQMDTFYGTCDWCGDENDTTETEIFVEHMVELIDEGGNAYG